MKEDGASDKPIDIAVLTRMKQFRAMNKLKKVALKVRVWTSIATNTCAIPVATNITSTTGITIGISFFSFQVIAENLSEEEIIGLKEMFKSMDTDNSGTITYEELRNGLPKLGTKLSESEVRQLMEAVVYLLMYFLSECVFILAMDSFSACCQICFMC